MRIADSHCHLTMEAFDADRDAVIAQAGAAGVELLVTVPARKGDAAACAALAEAHPGIFATAGLHPHEAKDWGEETEAELRAALASPRVVAVGEIGLDYHYGLSPREDQVRCFRAQIGIAREARRPIVVHTRSAPQETLTILREERAWEIGGVVHCFTENRATAEAVLDLGLDLSFSGISTFPKATDIQAAAKIVPAGRILVETDAPYLAPVPHRGQRNVPAYVVQTALFLARLREEDPEELAERSLVNCRRVFRITA